MTGLRRISPRILTDLIATYDPELVSLFEALDPHAPGLGVAWAGEQVSANWFDVAREYTEKWHHQQQLRDAAARPLLYESALLVPALETFARGLSFAYRAYDAPVGSALSISTTGHASLGWTLWRTDRGWDLHTGVDSRATASLTLPADLAWRLWTKGIGREDARARVRVVGEAAAVEPLLSFVAIMV
jgi:hypothetical protein